MRLYSIGHNAFCSRIGIGRFDSHLSAPMHYLSKVHIDMAGGEWRLTRRSFCDHYSRCFSVLSSCRDPIRNLTMSIEAKLAALTLDDVPSIVDAVKKDGPEKSG